jgi:hypothetical protein
MEAALVGNSASSVDAPITEALFINPSCEHRCRDPLAGARPFRRAVALLAGTDDKQPADQAAPSSARPVGCVSAPWPLAI